MLLDRAALPQMQAAQLLTGLTMAAFVGASFLGQRATTIRMAVAGLYIAAALGFVAYLAL